MLSKPFYDEEIHIVASQLGKWKALGPNELLIGFFIDKWLFLGPCIWQLVRGLANGSIALQSINYIDIVLVSKGKFQTYPSDFRPISLCNSIYKILSNICNRISKVLPQLISKNQCAFIKGKKVVDNGMVGLDLVLQVYESKSHKISFKSNLCKAFDRIEYNLITYLLRRMQKLENMIMLIHKCLAFTHI